MLSVNPGLKAAKAVEIVSRPLRCFPSKRTVTTDGSGRLNVAAAVKAAGPPQVAKARKQPKVGKKRAGVRKKTPATRKRRPPPARTSPFAAGLDDLPFEEAGGYTWYWRKKMPAYYYARGHKVPISVDRTRVAVNAVPPRRPFELFAAVRKRVTLPVGWW